MKRNPEPAIRRQLRAEVGFGCPVDGCGIPWLAYHHFDPPWRERHHHDPDGMIALCDRHHREADTDGFSKETLRKLKRDPYLLRKSGSVGAGFSWRRSHLVVWAGGGLFVRCPVLLEVSGRPIIWLSLDDDGCPVLNFDLYDKTGGLAFEMRDNDWLAYGGLDDVETTPKKLLVKSKDRAIRLSLEFAPTSIDQLANELRLWSSMTEARLSSLLDAIAQPGRQVREVGDQTPGLIGEDDRTFAERVAAMGEIAECRIGADLPYPIHVHYTPTKIAIGSSVVTGCSIDTGTALSIG